MENAISATSASKPYIQDDWKVTRRLTHQRRYPLRVPDQSRGSAQQPVQLGRTPPFGTGYTHVTHAFRTNPNVDNFDPRFGSCVGRFRRPQNLASRRLRHVPRSRSDLRVLLRLRGNAAVRIAEPGESVVPDSVPGLRRFAPLPSLTFGTDYTIHKTPYEIQYNLNIQREMFKGSILTVGYVGSRGVDLLSFRDYNPPVPVKLPDGTLQFGNPTTGISYPRINPAFGTEVLTNPSSSSALQFTADQLEQPLRQQLRRQCFLCVVALHRWRLHLWRTRRQRRNLGLDRSIRRQPGQGKLPLRHPS